MSSVGAEAMFALQMLTFLLPRTVPGTGWEKPPCLMHCCVAQGGGGGEVFVPYLGSEAPAEFSITC